MTDGIGTSGAGATLDAAMSLVNAGRFADAEKLIRSVRAVFDDPLDVIDCDLQLASIHLRTGELTRAETVLNEVVTRASGLMDGASAEDRPYLKSAAFQAHTQLAAVYTLDGHPGRAVTLLTRAQPEETFECASMQGQLASCTLAAGDSNSAKAHADSALALLDELPADQWDTPTRMLHAAIRQVSGLVDSLCGNHTNARAALSDARTTYAELGLAAQAALIDAALGAIGFLAHRSPPSGGDESAVEAAMDSLLPAFLYLDDLRLQFPGASGRRAWKDSCSWILRAALEICLVGGADGLASEIIETAINSGVHSASAADADADGGMADLFKAMAETTMASAPRSGPGDARGPRGPAAVRLTAGTHQQRLLAELPMLPPPKLLLPNGRVALSEFHERRAQRYPPTGPRPQIVCRTW